MGSKDTLKRFEELNKNNTILCTENELQEFMVMGLLFKTGRSYVTRSQQKIKVNLIETKTYDFDLNFNNLISVCEEKSETEKIKRIYCMSQSCYNNYKEKGMIITQGSNEYYRLFEKELWLVYKY